MTEPFWNRLLDRLLAGFVHDANGRATALRGLAILARTDEPPESWLPLLDHEAERLEQFARGLAALRASSPEPLDPRDALAAARDALAAVHVDLQLEPAGPDGEDLSVVASRGALVRTVVGLALELADPHTVSLVHARAGRQGDAVVVDLWSDRGTASPPPSIPLAGARVTTTAGGYRLTLAHPSV